MVLDEKNGIRGTVPYDFLDTLITTIATGKAIRITAPSSDASWELSTAGGSDVLQRIDRIQERDGHTTALLLRGRRAESRVPLAPVPREVTARRVALTSIDQKLPDDVRDYWRHSCGDAATQQQLQTEAVSSVQLRLSDGTEIWRLPCSGGDQQGRQFILVYRVEGNLQALTQPYRHNGIEPRPLRLKQATFLTVPSDATGAAVSSAVATAVTTPGPPGLLFLSAFEPNKPAGCRTTWIWNGRWFDQFEQTCVISIGQDEFILSRARAVPSN